MIREIKVSDDWFWCSWHFFLGREGVLGIGHLVVFLFPQCVALVISASYAVNDIGEGTRKVISDLNWSLGFRHFLYVTNERTSFASWASAFESSSLVIGLKWTPDQKVACFLSRLNEISEGCEKIVPVSASFWSNWKFSRIIDLTAWLWEKQDSHVYRKNSTLPLIFRKSQSRHYINDEGWETVKKVWMRGWMGRWIKQVIVGICRFALKH